MKKVSIIAGGAGFIGTNLCKQLLKEKENSGSVYESDRQKNTITEKTATGLNGPESLTGVDLVGGFEEEINEMTVGDDNTLN